MDRWGTLHTTLVQAPINPNHQLSFLPLILPQHDDVFRAPYEQTETVILILIFEER